MVLPPPAVPQGLHIPAVFQASQLSGVSGLSTAYKSRGLQQIRLLLHRMCIHQSIEYDLQSSKGCVYGSTVCACIGRSSTSTIFYGMHLLLHHLCMYRSIGYGLQSFKRCVCCRTACAFISLLSMVYDHPKDAPIVVLLLQVLGPSGMVYNYSWDTSTAAQLVNILGTIYNHPWDASMAAPLVHVSVHRIRFRIIMECVYDCTACACIGLLGTVYNHPKDASTSAPLVHISSIGELFYVGGVMRHLTEGQ